MPRRNAVDEATKAALEEQGLTAPGNGRKPGENRGVNTGTQGLWGDDKTFTDLMKPMENPSIGRELVHPGKDALDISMRTVLKDRDEAKIVNTLLSWCREFDFPEGLEDIKGQLALYNSVGGYSRDQFIQAITQTYRGTPYQGQKQKEHNVFKKHDEDDDKKDRF